MHDIRFVTLNRDALIALVNGDLAAATQAAGEKLTQFLADEAWLWEIRAQQLAEKPQDAEWIAGPAFAGDLLVGHGGFHGGPDADGVVEVAYTVDPQYRRQGYARAMLATLLRRVDADPRVSAVRASIRPDNVGSLATIAGFGFRKTGEQWDPEDGLEIVFVRPAPPAAAGGR